MFLLFLFYKISCLFYLFGRWAKIPNFMRKLSKLVRTLIVLLATISCIEMLCPSPEGASPFFIFFAMCHICLNFLNRGVETIVKQKTVYKYKKTSSFEFFLVTEMYTIAHLLKYSKSIFSLTSN